jgi:acyl-CoA reductase-like NAD-dependent aldehyde dehydrogenase
MNTKMLTTRKEVFAPIVGLYKFDTKEDSIRMAKNYNIRPGAFRYSSGATIASRLVLLGLNWACSVLIIAHRVA